MRTESVLKALAVAVLVPGLLAACGDSSPAGGGGEGGGTAGGGGDGAGPVGGGGGTGGDGGAGGVGGAPPLNDDCATAEAVSLDAAESVVVTGTIDGAEHDYTTFCGDSMSSGLMRPEVVYEVTTAAACTLTVELTANDFDGVISIRPVCEEDGVGTCVNPAGNEAVSLSHAEAGTFTVLVTAMSDEGGTFNLELTCAPPACGDSVINGTEDCDDGGTAPGDGCDASCIFEPSAPELDDCAAAEMAPALIIATADGLVKVPNTGERTTTGATDSGTGSCMYVPDGTTSFPSADHIYRVIPQQSGDLTITLGNEPDGTPGCDTANAIDGGIEPPGPTYPLSCYDRAIHVRSGGCGAADPEVGCNDDSQIGANGWWDVETLVIPVTAMTEYFIFVDGWLDFGDGSDRGEYVLELELTP